MWVPRKYLGGCTASRCVQAGSPEETSRMKGAQVRWPLVTGKTTQQSSGRTVPPGLKSPIRSSRTYGNGHPWLSTKDAPTSNQLGSMLTVALPQPPIKAAPPANTSVHGDHRVSSCQDFRVQWQEWVAPCLFKSTLPQELLGTRNESW